LPEKVFANRHAGSPENMLRMHEPEEPKKTRIGRGRQD
jgi:hypothetical protein